MHISNDEILRICIESVEKRNDLTKKQKSLILRGLRRCLPAEAVTRQRSCRYSTREEWLACFQTQFQKHHREIRSARTYNLAKDDRTPSWSTICTHVGVSTWTELMALAGVSYATRRKTVRPQAVTSATSPYLDRLQQLNAERRALNEEFLRQLEQKKSGHSDAF